MQERRKYFRLQEEDKISYSVVPSPKAERMLTEDVSIGGLRIISDHFISPQSFLRVCLKLNDAQKIINALAQVRWIRAIFDDERYELGIEFIDISKEDMQFLKYYLARVP